MKSRAGIGLAGVLLAALWAGAPAARADGAAESARIAELERRLEQSLRRIDELAAKLERLEAGEAIAGQREQGARLDALEHHVGNLGAGLDRRAGAGATPLRGFADVGYVHSGRSDPGGSGAKGFGVGSVDLYLTPRFGDRVKALVELVFEVEDDGGLATDLERAQIGYAFGDAATAWLGRFHTPYGHWNTAFHHGAQIQAALSRPRFLEFEDRGGILPAHLVGLWLQGKVAAGGGRLGYDAFVGNGSRIEFDSTARGLGTLALNFARDDDHSATVGANVAYEFGAPLDGLRLGGHWLQGKVRATDTAGLAPGARTRLQFAGPHLAYTGDAWEWLAEAYWFRNRDLSNGSGRHASNAWFVQGARSFGPWTPYARLERARLAQGDSYFARQESGRSYRRALVGLRYDLDEAAALKLELNRTRVEAIPDGLGGTLDDRYGELRMQYSIRF